MLFQIRSCWCCFRLEAAGVVSDEQAAVAVSD